MPILVSSYKHIGLFHENYCEDEVVSTIINERFQVAAVMDGCTMGTESHFASTLAKKILLKIAKDLSYQALYTQSPEDSRSIGKALIMGLHHELRQIKNSLLMEINELLFTLGLAVVDLHTNAFAWWVIGDGLVAVDQVITEFDQDDKPDYFAYHLSEDASTWCDDLTQKGQGNSFQNLALSTDGVLTFQGKQPLTIDPIRELMIEQAEAFDSRYLLNRCRSFEDEGYRAGDDLGLVRMVVTGV